jgi:hypothetical protein
LLSRANVDKPGRSEKLGGQEIIDGPTLKKTENNIHAWQRHYRKVFPSFIFYFDGLPVDLRVRFSRQAGLFGAVGPFDSLQLKAS